MDIKRDEYNKQNEEQLDRLGEGFDDKKIPADVLAKKAQFTPEGKEIGGSTGGVGGGLVLVDELPEVGDPVILYKTPEGKLWSCTNAEGTRIICDLEVGKSYKLVTAIKARDLRTVAGKLFNTIHNYSFVSGQQYPMTTGGVSESSGEINANITYALGAPAAQYVSSLNDDTMVEVELYNTREVPSVTLTQFFVESINVGCSLFDLIPLFQDSYHTEEGVISTWTEVGATKKYYRHVIDIYANDLTACSSGNVRIEIINDKDNVYDFDSLYEYLENNGYIDVDNEYPCLAQSYGNETSNIDFCWVFSEDGNKRLRVYTAGYVANSDGSFKDEVIPFVEVNA